MTHQERPQEVADNREEPEEAEHAQVAHPLGEQVEEEEVHEQHRAGSYR